MKTAKERSGRPGAKKVSAERKGSRNPVDLAEIRQQITNLVGNDAVGMVETTIEEVGKGHYLGMKYLFELPRIRWRRRCCVVWDFRNRPCRKKELPKISKLPLRFRTIA